jgi:enterochelin esterase-like enzyme
MIALFVGCLGLPAAFAQAPSHLPATAQPQAMAGKYERITVHGASLVGNLEGDSPDRMVSVYLPPGYAKNSKSRYPVLYLLHGFTDSDSNWFGLHGPHFVNVQRAVDRAFAAGAMEMIIVMPDAYTRYLGSMYSSSATTGLGGVLTKDLVSYIDGHYRTLAQRASRGLAGHSMGGYGTIRLGMKYPQVFSSLYAMNPCCLGALLEPNVEAVERAAKVRTDEEIVAADFFTKAMLASAAAWSPIRATAALFDLPVVDGKRSLTIAQWANARSRWCISTSNLKQFDAIAVDAGDKDLPPIRNGPHARRHLTAWIARGRDLRQRSVNRVEGVSKKVLPFFGEREEQNDGAPAPLNRNLRRLLECRIRRRIMLNPPGGAGLADEFVHLLARRARHRGIELECRHPIESLLLGHMIEVAREQQWSKVGELEE